MIALWIGAHFLLLSTAEERPSGFLDVHSVAMEAEDCILEQAVDCDHDTRKQENVREE